MTDLANVIADYLQQNQASSNPGSTDVTKAVTAQSVEIYDGNPSNPGNPEKNDAQAIRQRLIDAANVSGLSVEQLWSFLDESDIDDLQQGLISQQELNAYAQSWARYPKLVPVSNTLPLPPLYEAKKAKYS